MAGDAVTTAVDPAGGIAAYLVALDASLAPAPRRARGQILDELGDGLRTAAQRYRDRGAAPAAAVEAALAEFGAPRVVARAFAEELATARARRLLGGLLLTGPLVGIWWLVLLAPHDWPPHPAELVAAIPVLPLVGATVAVAVAVLAATGRLAHRLPTLSPWSTVRTGHAAAIACFAVDATLLFHLAILASTPAGHPAVIMAAAAAASLMRLLCIAVAAARPRR